MLSISEKKYAHTLIKQLIDEARRVSDFQSSAKPEDGEKLSLAWRKIIDAVSALHSAATEGDA